MKKQHIALIALFLGFLIMPTVAGGIFGKLLNTGNNENRTLAAFPDVSEVGFEFPVAFEAYYNDHLPFKNQLTALHSELFLSLFNTTSNPRVIVGREGWLFYNNYDAENPVDDLLGKSGFTEAEMQGIADNITDTTARLAADGRTFLFMLPPNKEAIYQEYLPDYLLENAVSTPRADILYNYLTAQGVDILYPKQALLDAKTDEQVYYKYDTHWNRLGGYIGFQQMCAALDIDLPALNQLTISAQEAYPKDLAQLAGIGSIATDDADYVVDLLPTVNVVHEEESADGAFNRYSSDAADDRTILLIHDSYYKSMIEYFPRVFGTVIAVHRDYADLYGAQALIEQYDCDIIVMQVVERGASLLLHENMPY